MQEVEQYPFMIIDSLCETKKKQEIIPSRNFECCKLARLSLPRSSPTKTFEDGLAKEAARVWCCHKSVHLEREVRDRSRLKIELCLQVIDSDQQTGINKRLASTHTLDEPRERLNLRVTRVHKTTLGRHTHDWLTACGGGPEQQC